MIINHKVTQIDDELGIPLCIKQPAVSDGSHATLFSFMGANGGVGVTSLCVQLAYDLTQRNQGRVCLIDLDFENGATASYLDMTPSLYPEELSINPDRMDQDLVKSFLTQHVSGLNIIAAYNSLDGNRQINTQALLSLLDHVSEMFDYIIMDIPRLWTPWTHAAIAASDTFSMVCELTIPSLKSLQSRELMIQNEIKMDRPVGVVINKHERRSFRNALKIKDAEKTIGRPLSSAIGIYADFVKDAINRGVPMGVANPKCRYNKEAGKLLDSLLQDIDAQPHLQKAR